jgi:hypothetical protein
MFKTDGICTVSPFKQRDVRGRKVCWRKGRERKKKVAGAALEKSCGKKGQTNTTLVLSPG